jgi:hypothetical protein
MNILQIFENYNESNSEGASHTMDIIDVAVGWLRDIEYFFVKFKPSVLLTWRSQESWLSEQHQHHSLYIS